MLRGRCILDCDLRCDELRLWTRKTRFFATFFIRIQFLKFAILRDAIGSVIVTRVHSITVILECRKKCIFKKFHYIFYIHALKLRLFSHFFVEDRTYMHVWLTLMRVSKYTSKRVGARVHDELKLSNKRLVFTKLPFTIFLVNGFCVSR